MSASHVRRILLALLLATGASGQSRSIAVAVFPSESTLHFGQMHTFTAVITGTNDAALQHVDNLGAYTESRPETGLLIPSVCNNYPRRRKGVPRLMFFDLKTQEIMD
jgi:hypothetical protein